MVVKTKSDKAINAQQGVMEFLLINHPLDCPICDQGGECQLQDLAVGYGASSSRYDEDKRVVYPKDVGPLLSMQEMNRCIHCTRCVRFGIEVGGVMELGMMLDVDTGSLRTGFWRHFPVAAVVGVVIALEMAAVLLPGFRLVDAPTASAAALKLGNSKLLGIEVYTRYLYPLQIAAVVLLVAIIAAISLTHRARKDTKHVHPSEQVKAKKADRVRIVSLKPEPVQRDAPSDAPKPVGDRR